MLNYTFSKREKVMLVILAIILVALAWYFLVFQNVTSQITSLEGQIQDTQTTVTTDTAKVTKMKQMQSTIDTAKAEGKKAAALPKYDNLQNVMVSLNDILGQTSGYTLDFDTVDSSASPVARGVDITFSCDSYSQARSIIDSIANGPYYCSVDTLDITSATRSRITAQATATSYTAKVHVTYYETK